MLFSDLFLSEKVFVALNPSQIEKLPISVHLVDSGEVWVGRSAVLQGFSPSDLSSKLEFDLIRNPLQFALFVKFAKIYLSDLDSPILRNACRSKFLEIAKICGGKNLFQISLFERVHVHHGLTLESNNFYIPISSNYLSMLNGSTWPHYEILCPDGVGGIEIYRGSNPNQNSVPAAVYIGFAGNWYHFVVDVIPSLIEYLNSDIEQSPVIIQAGLAKSIVSLCQILTGKPPIEVGIGQSLVVEKLHVIQSRVVESSYELMAQEKLSRLRDFRSRILSYFELPASQQSEEPMEKFPSKIFVIRSKGLFRPLRNQRRIARVLTKKGFFVVDPSNIDLANQIQLFNHAQLIVCETGAAMTNIIFAKPSAAVIELNPGFKGEDLQFWERYSKPFVAKYRIVFGKRFFFGQGGFARDGHIIRVATLMKALNSVTLEAK